MGSTPPPSSTPPEPRPRRKRRQTPLVLSLAINLLIALVVVSLVQAFVIRVHNVSSGSMEQTLGVSDRVLSSHLPYLNSDPARGDIVIFGHGDSWEADRITPSANPLKAAVRLFGDLTGIGVSNTTYTVKRVIGVAGDKVECCDQVGAVVVNGAAIEEPYIYQDLPFQAGTLDCTTTPRSARCFIPITVPEGQLLVMGDHRGNSSDSVIACRAETATADCARFVRVDQVNGKLLARIWPPGPVR